MSLLLESIRITDGCWQNAGYHRARMERSTQALFGQTFSADIESIVIPSNFRSGVVKCRLLYDTAVHIVEFEPYKPRTIHSLKLVTADDIDYSHKWADRSALNELLKQKGEADDIIIVKNGQITDMSYANVVLRLDGGLYTPANCLLKGTRRQQLLDEGLIRERELTVADYHRAESVILINAMLGLENIVF